MSKNIYVILLSYLIYLIPTLSYSQITLEDIMGINSEKAFKRVMIENGYEFTSENDTLIEFGYNNKFSFWIDYVFGNEMSINVSSYNKINGGFFLTCSDNFYNLIVSELKEKCVFFKLMEKGQSNLVVYNCSQLKHEVKIGVSVQNGMNIITYLPEEMFKEHH